MKPSISICIWAETGCMRVFGYYVCLPTIFATAKQINSISFRGKKSQWFGICLNKRQTNISNKNETRATELHKMREEVDELPEKDKKRKNGFVLCVSNNKSNKITTKTNKKLWVLLCCSHVVSCSAFQNPKNVYF